MEFDKRRVYTALNADELKAGSLVVLADNLFDLKTKVADNKYICKLERVLEENNGYRFKDNKNYWLLAYLVKSQKEKVLKWTDLKVGDVIRAKDGSETALVIGIRNYSPDGHINIGYWQRDSDLEKYLEKAED